MLISKKLTPSLIKLDVESRTKEALFEEMVHLLKKEGLIKDYDEAVQALIEREAKMSTGISAGFGLPHARLEYVKGEVAMALGVIRDGMDFDSLDGEPVYVVIVLFSIEGNPVPHIEALAEISRHLSMPDFIDKIRGAKTPEDVIQIFKQNEEE